MDTVNSPAKRRPKREKKKLYEYEPGNDIRYAGPLSYQSFRIFGWLCVALSQAAVLMQLGAKMDPSMADSLQTPVLILQSVGTMALPFFLIANFSVILNARGGYAKQLRSYAVLAAAVAGVTIFFFSRYVLGGAAVFLGTRSDAMAALEELFRSGSATGYLEFNIFIDLLLCTLLLFFVNYRPKRVFIGKKLVVFRAFAAIPILYEVASITLKLLAVQRKIELPFIVFPFLTVKPPLTFLVFIALVFFIKNRERSFRKNGKTHEDFHEFLKTKRNSWQFSRFTAVLLAVAGVLDLAALFIYPIVLSMQNGPDLELPFVMSRLSAFGLGASASLLLLAPLMLLYSYTRVPKIEVLDTYLPVIGVALIALVYIEGGHQLILMLPDMQPMLGQGSLDGLGGLFANMDAAEVGGTLPAP